MTTELILQKIDHCIKKNNLFSQKERVIIAVSGGADSTALLLLLDEYSKKFFPLEFAVASIDHGLRLESAKEVEWVRKLSEGLNLPFFTTQLHLLKDNNLIAIEERARQGRYEFLYRVAEEWGFSKIAIAHHVDDQIETILFRLFQGTGISGLGGIRPQSYIFPNSHIQVVRPLLECTKLEILGYLSMRKQKWCEDESNSDIHYTRNLLRQQIIPLIKKDFPSLNNAILDIADYCQNTTEYFQNKAKELFSQYVYKSFVKCPQLCILWEILAQRPLLRILSCKDAQNILPILQSWLLQEIVRSLGLNPFFRSSHYQLWEKLLNQNTGKIIFPNLLEVTKTLNWITFFLPLPKDLSLPQFIEIPDILKIDSNKKVISLNHFLYLSIERTHIVDIDSLSSHPNFLQIIVSIEPNRFPLQIRYCQPQDKIQVFGNFNHSRLTQIFSDIHVPIPWRSQMLVVCDCHNIIIWIPGICISESVRITSQTSYIWKLFLEKNKAPNLGL